MNDSQKVHSEHLKRDAYLYVRQSTLHQVVENTESTERQYGLRTRAIQLGWPAERVISIDQDQAQSAATAGDREGFEKLVTEVGMGRVGIVLPNCHAGYISWEEFQQNQRRLRENSAAHGKDRRRGPPREGPALLQGIVVCGRCGKPMTVCYRNHKNGPELTYVCRHKNIERAEAACQYIAGAKLDEAVAALLLEMVTPLSLQVALEVQDSLQTQLDEADRLRRQQVQRARYEADLAKQRFMRVDPNHRLVADALEAEWNEKLRMLNDAQETCDRQRQADRAVLNEKQRQEVLALAEDFPRLWRDPRVSHRERKRMVRLLIEDVTLLRGEQVSIGICFRGGATRSLTIPVPLPAYRTWQTSPEIVAQIDRLLDQHTEGEIAARLNAQGLRSGKGGCFRGTIIAHIRRRYHLKSRYDRLRKTGMLTVKEIAKRWRISTITAHRWRRLGILKAHAYNDKHRYLFEPPSGPKPVSWCGKKLSDPQRFGKVCSQNAKEV